MPLANYRQDMQKGYHRGYQGNKQRTSPGRKPGKVVCRERKTRLSFSGGGGEKKNYYKIQQSVRFFHKRGETETAAEKFLAGSAIRRIRMPLAGARIEKGIQEKIHGILRGHKRPYLR